MLKQLRLKNFKQHRDLVVNFDKGLNAIQGENAHGKTTILKAILFALQGVTGAGNKDHLTTRGETGMKVELDWDLGAVGQFTITRSLSSAKVTKGGELIASGQTPVTKWTEDQLGMASKLFKSLLYAEQGKTQKLLDDGPTDLQKQLEAVAQSSVIDAVLGMIKTDNDHAEGELAGIGPVPDINALRRLLEATQVEVRALAKDLSDWDSEVQAAEQALKCVKDTYERNLEDSLVNRQLLIEQGRLEGEKNILTTQRIQLEANEIESVDQTALDQLETSITNLSLNLSTQQRALDRLVDEHKAQATLRKRVEALEPWRDVITEWESLEQAVGIAQDTADLTQRVVGEKADEINRASCAACHRPFEDKDMAVLNANLEKAKDEHRLAVTELTQATTELVSFFAKHGTDARKLNATRSTLRDLDIQIKALPELAPIDPNAQDAILEGEDEVKTQKERLLDLRDRLRAYNEWVNRLNSVRQSLEHVEQRLEVVNTKLANLTLPSDEQLRELKAQVDTVTTTLNINKVQRTETSQKYTEAEQRQQRLTDQIAEGEEKADRVARIKHEIANRVELQKFLRNNRSRLMDEAWTALTTYTSHLVSSVTDGFITDLTRDESGNFFAVEGGHPTPVEELSGAQKSIIGLCLRLSLSHLFYGDSGFVLLDEVTADCSEANAARVAGMLRGLNSQALMVTHRQGDALNANNVILLS